MSTAKTVMIGVLLVVVGPSALSLMTPVMPLIASDFGVDDSYAKLTITAYTLGLVSGQLASGTLSDSYGRKRIVAAFLGLFMAGTVLALSAARIEVLIAARVLQGIGAAAGWATSRAMVRDLYDGPPAARIMSQITMFMLIIPALMPILGGLVGNLAGWRGVFAAMTVIGAAIYCAVLWGMVETLAPANRKPVSLRETVTSYRYILTNRQFLCAAAAMGASAGIMYAQLSLLPYVVIEGLGFSPVMFGLFAAIQALSAASAAWLNSQLLVRYRMRDLVVVAMSATITVTLGIGAYLLLHPANIVAVIFVASVYAMANGIVMPNTATLAVSPFGQTAGAASSLVGLSQVGMGFLGSFAAAFIPSALVSLILVPLVFSVVGFVIFRKMPAEAQAAADQDV